MLAHRPVAAQSARRGWHTTVDGRQKASRAGITRPTCMVELSWNSGFDGVVDLEGDLGVDAVVLYGFVLDDRLELLDVYRLDAVDALGCVLQGLLGGVVPALLGLRKHFDDLDYRHGGLLSLSRSP